MPRAYSALGPMATKPYALGERPGGNYIPTQPLLSGVDAWDSLTQFYDKRFSLPYDTSARGPRHSQDVFNKAAMEYFRTGSLDELYKEAGKGGFGGFLRSLGVGVKRPAGGGWGHGAKPLTGTFLPKKGPILGRPADPHFTDPKAMDILTGRNWMRPGGEPKIPTPRPSRATPTSGATATPSPPAAAPTGGSAPGGSGPSPTPGRAGQQHWYQPPPMPGPTPAVTGGAGSAPGPTSRMKMPKWVDPKNWSPYQRRLAFGAAAAYPAAKVISDVPTMLGKIPGPPAASDANGPYLMPGEGAQAAPTGGAPAAAGAPAGGAKPPAGGGGTAGGTPTDSAKPGFMDRAGKFLGQYGMPIMGGTLALALLWHLLRKRKEKKRRDEYSDRYKYGSADKADQLLDAFAHDCPVLYGFIAGCMDKGASYEQMLDMGHRAMRASDKFAKACQDAAEPVAQFEKAAQFVLDQEHQQKTADIMYGMVVSTSPGGLATPFCLTKQALNAGMAALLPAMAMGPGPNGPQQPPKPQPITPAPVPGKHQAPQAPQAPQWPVGLPRKQVQTPQVPGGGWLGNMFNSAMQGWSGANDPMRWEPEVPPEQMSPLQRQGYGQFVQQRGQYAKDQQAYQQANALNEDVPYWDRSLMQVPEGLRLGGAQQHYDPQTQATSYELPFHALERGVFPELRNPVMERDPETGGVSMLGRYDDASGQLVADPEATARYHEYVNKWNQWQQNRKRWVDKWKGMGDEGAAAYWNAYAEANPSLAQPIRTQSGKDYMEREFPAENNWFAEDVSPQTQYSRAMDEAMQRGRQGPRYQPKFSDMFWDAPEPIVREAAEGQLFKPKVDPQTGEYMLDENGQIMVDDTNFQTLMYGDEEGNGNVRGFARMMQDQMDRSAPGFSGYGQTRQLSDPNEFIRWANDKARSYFAPRVNTFDEVSNAFNTFGAGYYDQIQDPNTGMTLNQQSRYSTDPRRVPGLMAYPGDVATDTSAYDPREGRFQKRWGLYGPYTGGSQYIGDDPISRIRNVTQGIRRTIDKENDAEANAANASTWRWLTKSTPLHMDPEYMQQEYEARGYSKETAGRLAAKDAFNMMTETGKESAQNQQAAASRRQQAFALLPQDQVQARAEQLYAGDMAGKSYDDIMAEAGRQIAGEQGGDTAKKFQMFLDDADRISGLKLKRKNYGEGYWGNMGTALTQQQGGDPHGVRGFLDQFLPSWAYGGDIGAGTGNVARAIPRQAGSTIFGLPASLATSAREGNWGPTQAALRDMRAVPDAFWEASTGGKLSENLSARPQKMDADLRALSILAGPGTAGLTELGNQGALSTGQNTYFGTWQDAGQMNVDAAKNPEEFRNRMNTMQNDLLLFDEANNPQLMQKLQTNVDTMREELAGVLSSTLSSDEVGARAQELYDQNPDFQQYTPEEVATYAARTLSLERLATGDVSGMPEETQQAVEEWRTLARRQAELKGLGIDRLRDMAQTNPQAQGLLDYLEKARDWKRQGAFDYAEQTAQAGEDAGALGRLGMRATGSFSRSLPGTLDALAMLGMMGGKGPGLISTPLKYQAGFGAAEPAFETMRWGLDETGVQPWLDQGAEQIRMRSSYNPNASFPTRMGGELLAKQVEDPSALAMLAASKGLGGIGNRLAGNAGLVGRLGGWANQGAAGLRELGMWQAGLRPLGAATNIAEAGQRMRAGQQYAPEELMQSQMGEQRALPFLSDALAGLMGVKPKDEQVAKTEPLTDERLALPEGVQPLPDASQLAQQPGIPGVQEGQQLALNPQQIAQASPTTVPQAFGLDPQKMQELGQDGELAATQAMGQALDTAGKMNADEIAGVRAAAQEGDATAPGAQIAINNIANSGGTNAKTATDIWTNMDPGARMLAGLGVALGTISLLSSLSGEDGGGLGGFLGAVLGFGTAAGVLAHGGLFGQEAQQFTQGITNMFTSGELGTSEMTGDPEAAAKQQEADQAAIDRVLGRSAAPAEGGEAPAEGGEAPAEGGEAPAANPQQTAFGKLIGDNRITREEMQQIQNSPELRDYVFGLPDDAALAALRAAARGDPEAAKKFQSIKKHKAHAQEIAGALAQPVGKDTFIGADMGLLGRWGENVGGMGFTPAQARRFVELAQQM